MFGIPRSELRVSLPNSYELFLEQKNHFCSPVAVGLVTIRTEGIQEGVLVDSAYWDCQLEVVGTFFRYLDEFSSK